MGMSLSKLPEMSFMTGKPGLLQRMGSGRVGQDGATEQAAGLEPAGRQLEGHTV